MHELHWIWLLIVLVEFLSSNLWGVNSCEFNIRVCLWMNRQLQRLSASNMLRGFVPTEGHTCPNRILTACFLRKFHCFGLIGRFGVLQASGRFLSCLLSWLIGISLSRYRTHLFLSVLSLYPSINSGYILFVA